MAKLVLGLVSSANFAQILISRSLLCPGHQQDEGVMVVEEEEDEWVCDHCRRERRFGGIAYCMLRCNLYVAAEADCTRAP
nr:hypothetical protein BaRGS_019235 [Batillaria attramentaria]